ncbi:MAG: hypothetical protein AB4352_07015 [Hormoscilla sp.]
MRKIVKIAIALAIAIYIIVSYLIGEQHQLLTTDSQAIGQSGATDHWQLTTGNRSLATDQKPDKVSL